MSQNQTTSKQPTSGTARNRKRHRLIAGLSASVIALGCLGVFGGCSKDSVPEENTTDTTAGDASAETDTNGAAAVTTNYEVTKQMFACYYQDMITMFINNYGEDALLNYYQLDVSKPLKDQPYPTDDSTTWFDVIVDETGDTLSKQLVIAEAAKAAGYELSDEDKQSIDNMLASIDLSIYGNDVTEEDVRKELELQAYSSGYYNTFMEELEPSDADIQAYLEEHLTDFETCGLMGFAINYVLDEDVTEATDEDGESTELPPLTKDEAKELSDKLIASEDEVEFATTVCEYLIEYEGYTDEELPNAIANIRNDSYGYTQGSLAEWAFSGEADVNDTLLLENENAENNTGTYYVYMLTRTPGLDDTKTVNVRHILFNTSVHEDEATDDKTALEICKELADETLQEWEDGEATEESFAALATEKTEDPGSIASGGLYENVGVGQMVTEFDDWIFDSSRKPGDTDVIKTGYGYHVMYFVGDAEPVWKTNARAMLQNQLYNEWYTEQADTYTVTLNDAVMKSIDG